MGRTMVDGEPSKVQSELQRRYTGEELPKERPEYLSENHWRMIVEHLVKRRSYDNIARDFDKGKPNLIRAGVKYAIGRIIAAGHLKTPGVTPAMRERYARIRQSLDDRIDVVIQNGVTEDVAVTFPVDDLLWLVNVAARALED